MIITQKAVETRCNMQRKQIYRDSFVLASGW